MVRGNGLATTLLLSRNVAVKQVRRRRRRTAILVRLTGTEYDPKSESWTEMTPLTPPLRQV